MAIACKATSAHRQFLHDRNVSWGTILTVLIPLSVLSHSCLEHAAEPCWLGYATRVGLAIALGRPRRAFPDQAQRYATDLIKD